MKFLQSYELNKARWDKLVEPYGTQQTSWYLDEVAKKWGAFVDDSYTKGVAISFNEVLGQKMIYPATYTRSFVPVNLEKADWVFISSYLEKHFSSGVWALTKTMAELDLEHKSKEFQVLNDKLQLNQQAKRMLKKASKSNVTVKETDWNSGIQFISEELLPKVDSLGQTELSQLKKLLNVLETKEKLISQGIYNAGKLEGVMYYVREHGRIRYLKGAARKALKDRGGMYFAMHEQLQYTLEQNLTFDFGGLFNSGYTTFFSVLLVEKINFIRSMSGINCHFGL